MPVVIYNLLMLALQHVAKLLVVNLAIIVFVSFLDQGCNSR